jgi:DegV family protein with EDD domain
MAEGLIVLSAVAAAEAGGDLDDVTAAAVATRGSMQLFGALDSLDNLRKGGRLGSAQALLGGLLDIKPVLEINDGVLELESRPRTRSRSFERLVSKLREAGDIERLAIVHAAASDIDVFVELVASSLAKDRISVGWLGPVIGTHVGRGTVALAVQRRVS